jgi:hypothetical protein
MDLISGAGGVAQGSGKGNAPVEGEAEGGGKMVKVMKDGKLVSVPAQSRSDRQK